jgi:hypothetical protein
MAASGVPTAGWLLFAIVVALLVGAAVLGESLGRRAARRSSVADDRTPPQES